MRVFLFLQLIALVIFVYTMYFLPSNLYFISVVSIFIIVNTVGLTYYIFRAWAKELIASSKSKWSRFLYFLLVAVAIVGITFLFLNISGMWISKYSEDSLANFTNSLLVVSTFLLVSFGIAYLTLRRELERQLREYEKLKGAQQKLSIQVIRYKTNPHFLYNSLSTAISMLDLGEAPEAVKEYLSNLAELFRTVFQAPEVWTLKDELELAARYLEIQKLRIEGLNYEIKVDAECDKVRIPSLVLQPIVENAVIHGIAKSKDGRKILIECFIENGRVVIKVIDDGKGSENIVPGTGLKLVEELLKAFARNVELKVESYPEKGTTVILSWQRV
ncbi:sensor histidine kinase [Fervidobacterium islandicum]|uniref:sensor histidine kinase n=1 Tax=Fervidobacterium islandicum TaxID=2423 RepID=UPI003A77193F